MDGKQELYDRIFEKAETRQSMETKARFLVRKKREVDFTSSTYRLLSNELSLINGRLEHLKS